MNPASEDIKDLLEAQEIGTLGTDLFISAFPDKPDLCMCLVDTPGWKDPETNYDTNYPSLQVLVRGTPSGYLTAYAKAQEVVNYLHTLHNTTQDAVYVGIVQASEIFCIGRDGESNRPIFSVNFNITRKPSS